MVVQNVNIECDSDTFVPCLLLDDDVDDNSTIRNDIRFLMVIIIAVVIVEVGSS